MFVIGYRRRSAGSGASTIIAGVPDSAIIEAWDMTSATDVAESGSVVTGVAGKKGAIPLTGGGNPVWASSRISFDTAGDYLQNTTPPALGANLTLFVRLRTPDTQAVLYSGHPDDGAAFAGIWVSGNSTTTFAGGSSGLSAVSMHVNGGSALSNRGTAYTAIATNAWLTVKVRDFSASGLPVFVLGCRISDPTGSLSYLGDMAGAVLCTTTNGDTYDSEIRTWLGGLAA